MIWAVFSGLVVSLFALDFLVFSRRSAVPTLTHSLLQSLLFVAVAVGFGLWLTVDLGADQGMKFFTAYVLELSLSFDNIFVISLIFGALSIPPQYRHRVLFWGIMGAILLRGIFISLGAAIVEQFHWALLGFAAFLIYGGVKILLDGGAEQEVDIEKNKILGWMRKYLRITPILYGQQFFTSILERVFVTPLFVALVLVEFTDLIFAFDSIPATFSVTTDPLLVYTSNIFAVLGLRSMFFVLEAIIHRFESLGKVLAVVLVFIGGKVVCAELLGWEIPNAASMGIVLAMIGGGIIFSAVRTRSSKIPKSMVE